VAFSHREAIVTADILSRPHLSFITRDADAELACIQQTIDSPFLVSGRCDLEDTLGKLLALGTSPTKKTLDLIGHTTSDKSLLMIGDWMIDATNATVTSFFRGLADSGVLERLGIDAVRLLGCSSADTAHGRWTICRLAEVLGVEVYGTTGIMFASHYGSSGLAEERGYLLVSASELRTNTVVPRPIERTTATEHTLDIDRLAAAPLAERATHRLVIADRDEARALLRLVRRRDGSVLPGLLAVPACEVALPAAEPGRYHLLQILMEGEIVRAYPHGHETHGIVYPVDDPHALMSLIAALPAARR
jgi:hypothetical protein